MRCRAGNAWERRVEAWRTEVEPEQEPQVWGGWDFGPVGGCMADQLAAIDSATTLAQRVAAQPGAAKLVGKRLPGEASYASTLPQLLIRTERSMW
jgi:hypothetical protein